MYSPRRLLFTTNLRPIPSVASITTTAPSTGCCLASTTLPLTWPVWASAGPATSANPSSNVQTTIDRRISAPCIATSVLHVLAAGGRVLVCPQQPQFTTFQSGAWLPDRARRHAGPPALLKGARSGAVGLQRGGAFPVRRV